MAEYLEDRAAKLAASAQKTQQTALSRAATIISRDYPDFLKTLAFSLLGSGKVLPEDITGETPKANAKKHRKSRRLGRHRNGIRPFPMSFPVGSGITWDNLYDVRTEKILSSVARYIAESRLFGADLEDIALEVREELPFRLQSFKPVPGNPEARYDFTANACFNLAKTHIRRRMREIEQGMPTISLEEHLDPEGEFKLKDAIGYDDPAVRRYEVLDELRLVFPQLEPQDQAIAFLGAYLGLSLSQMSARLGLSETGVEYRFKTVIPRIAREIRDRDLGGAK